MTHCGADDIIIGSRNIYIWIEARHWIIAAVAIIGSGWASGNAIAQTHQWQGVELDTVIHEYMHASDSILHDASSWWEDQVEGTLLEGLFNGHTEIHNAAPNLAELIFDEAENMRWCK